MIPTNDRAEWLATDRHDNHAGRFIAGGWVDEDDLPQLEGWEVSE